MTLHRNHVLSFTENLEIKAGWEDYRVAQMKQSFDLAMQKKDTHRRLTHSVYVN